MDKSHAQSAISKSKPVSTCSSSESEDHCEIKCKNTRNYTIRGFLKTWKMEYLVSPIPDCSKPQC